MLVAWPQTVCMKSRSFTLGVLEVQTAANGRLYSMFLLDSDSHLAVADRQQLVRM